MTTNTPASLPAPATVLNITAPDAGFSVVTLTELASIMNSLKAELAPRMTLAHCPLNRREGMTTSNGAVIEKEDTRIMVAGVAVLDHMGRVAVKRQGNSLTVTDMRGMVRLTMTEADY